MQVPEGGKFLKGLAVVNHVAFFGISPSTPREARNDEDLDCELAAFDLVDKELVWRRKARPQVLSLHPKTRDFSKD